MTPRHFLADDDLNRAQIEALLALASEMKRHKDKFRKTLAGKTLGMIFQKSSTRTRVSFEVGMLELGGHALFLSARDIQIGRGESIPDTARVLSRYVDILMARVYGHADVETLAAFSRVPVINGLSDLFHPCQALADFLTLHERFGGIEGRKLCYVGDGNNVAHSLMLMGAILGAEVVVVTPEGFAPGREILDRAWKFSKNVHVVTDLRAVAGADAIYTDVWASMGQEEEHAARVKIFEPYRVTSDVMRLAKPSAVFLHCLPAHRGEEVTDAVIDSAQSAVWEQAENRLHAQKALMATLMGAT